MQVILVLLSLVVSALGQTSQTCQVCHSSNGVYCFNQTYYQYCMKNTLMGDVLKCVTGQYCSAENGVCTSDATKSSCDSSGGSEASCTQCTRDKTFACLSKTEFARCTSGGSPAFTASCEAGDICVESSYETYGTLCVPPCVANFADLTPTCSNEAYTPPTEAPIEAPDSATQVSYCQLSEKTDDYFFVKYETSCSSYLYCERGENADDWATVFLTCPATKPYFNPTTSVCVANKPSSCTS